MANPKAFKVKVHQANLKCTIKDNDGIKTVYKRIEHSHTDWLDYAIKNMAMKTGMLSVESITPEEYQEATDESKT